MEPEQDYEPGEGVGWGVILAIIAVAIWALFKAGVFVGAIDINDETGRLG